MKDLGEVINCLGLEENQDRTVGILTLSRSKYILDILHQVNMQDSNPISTPSLPGLQLTRPESTESTESHTHPY